MGNSGWSGERDNDVCTKESYFDACKKGAVKNVARATVSGVGDDYRLAAAATSGCATGMARHAYECSGKDNDRDTPELTDVEIMRIREEQQEHHDRMKENRIAARERD